MATGVEELLDMLYSMIDEAKSVPLSSERCMIERDRALDILDDVRAQFPMEIREAKKIQDSRVEYLNAAKREADTIKKQAEDDAAKMLSENELMTQARQKSTEMVQTAETQAKELRQAANEYCDDLLSRAEEAMKEAHEEIQQKHASFTASFQQNVPQREGARKAYDAEVDN